MDILNRLGSIAFLLLGMVLITAMIVKSVCMVIEDAKREEKENARKLARIWADREYKRLLKNTEFKVRQTFVISNESDIQW